MPRALSPAMLPMLQRANPNVADIVEISVPDQGAILRRADQFLQSPAPLVSMTPANSAVASPNGGLTLATTAVNLTNQYTDNGFFNIPQEDGGDAYINTVAWRLDPAFQGCVLSSFTARLHWGGSLFLSSQVNVKLQIFRARQVAGVIQRQVGSSTVETKSVQVSFDQLLAEPVRVSFLELVAQGALDGSLFADVVFDLTPYRLQIDAASGPPPGPGQTGDLPEVYFAVTTDQQHAGNFVEWRYDTTSAQTIAGVGKVREVSWARGNPSDPASVWVATESGRTLMNKIKVLQYSATSQEVFALTLAAAPLAASVGRVVFNAGAPSGTSASMELSTAGSGGPWTAVSNGDPIAVAQTTYHARLTMNASADARRAPVVSAVGVEWRNRIDISAESAVTHMSQEVSAPYLAASIGEGEVSVVRTGRRDYADPGADVAVSGPDTQLEVDIFTGSRHPAVGRKDWLHMTRASVSNRVPSGTAERFSLLSLTKTLKRKIPARIENINTVHTVQAGATTAAVTLSPALTGASSTGNEYDGRNYYVRVRSSATAGIGVGAVLTISGNTGTTGLEFLGNNVLPAAPTAGDVWEVHSGTYTQPALTWVDADLADIWWEILTVHLGVPTDRVGLSGVGGIIGRAGLPPRVTDRAPGDVAAQAKLRVTLRLTEAETGDELLDQISFLMGGATVEIAGQIVFRQIYPLRDATGKITVAPDAACATFDPRDYIGLETPTGREQRITTLACDYGANTLITNDDPVSTTVAVDVDALAAYLTQDVEGLGTGTIPAKIARWCYNATDGGLYLATMAAQQVVYAASTGLRLWSWVSVQARPELTIGDTVVIVTDQYTDYDPALRRKLRGWRAYTLTLIGTADGGRRFRGYMQGLRDTTTTTVAGGAGTIQDTNPPRLGDLTWSDDVTGVFRTYTWQRFGPVDSVWIFDKLLPLGGGDGWPTDTDTPTAIVRFGDADTYTTIKPLQGFERYVQIEPRTIAGSAGDTRRATIEAAPSTLAGKVKAAVTNDVADLSLEITAAASNWPVALALYEDDPDGAPIYTGSISTPSTITKLTAGAAALGARALPLRALRRWYLRMTDVSGVMIWAIGAADRDALPSGDVTATDYRPNPTFACTYDDDTDTIRVTVPGGKTKTFSGLTGGGVATYTVGMALDDASVESAFTRDETRTGYLVEYNGGGQWRTFWIGALHGSPGAGPSLDVRTSHGTTSSVITWVAGTAGTELSINGAAYSAAPASPITVTRPAVGAAALEYTFRLVLNGQTVTDTVTIPPIDADTATPDLAIAAGTTTDTTVPFTVTATNPSGGAAPTITVQLIGVSAVVGGVPKLAGTTTTVTTGTLVTVDRPAFGGANTANQPTVKFRASISGGGAEEINRTILPQVKTVFGPSLDVTATPGGSSYSVAYVGAGGTVQLSISGGAYSTAPASPITVSRPAAGGTPLEYTFRIIADGQTVVDSVTIQPVDADTVAADLTVTPSVPTNTTQDFQGTASNPLGGSVSMFAMIRGSTGSGSGGVGAMSDGVEYAVTNSTVVTANRPAFGTTTNASITFRAVIAGAASERIQRTIPNQVKTSFGPSLTVTPTPGSTSYSLAYSGAWTTILLSINGGSYSAPGSSPLTVTRTGSDQTYTFKATQDGIDITVAVTIPAYVPVGGSGVFVSLSQAIYSYATDQVQFNWTWSGSTATFDVYSVLPPFAGGGWYKAGSALSASPYIYTSALDLSTTPTSSTVIKFYVRAYSPDGVFIAESEINSATYGVA